MSGGLDSMLAVRVLQEQGIKVIGYTFVTPFFGPQSAIKASDTLGIRLEIAEITEIYMEMLKNPSHGYGRNMNPCVDCHTMMFRLAGERMAAEGARFLVSGEVLGERPFSQNRGALGIVASESGYEDHILRPLSARLLKKTPAEAAGWVDREQLLAIQGRSRKPQMALAEKFGITDYPNPAGGCRLTEPNFSRRLRDLLKHTPDPLLADLEMLKLGRHIRWDEGFKVIVGRREAENEQLETLCRPDDYRVWVKDIPGPVVILPDAPRPAQEALAVAARITVRYSDAPPGQPTEVAYAGRQESGTLQAEAFEQEEIQPRFI